MLKIISLASARSLLLLSAVLAGASVLLCDAARADTPEYWEREKFNTERSTIASLTTPREEGTAPVRAQRAGKARRFAARSAPSRLGGPKVEEARARPKRAKGVRVASLGRSFVPQAEPRKSLSGGGGIRWLANAGCLNGTLRGVVAQVAARFGSVTVNSTCRSRRHNRRVGGASRSLHLTGDAVDFRVRGNVRGAAAFLRARGGGYKHYGRGLFHIDTGVRRTW